MAPEVIGYGRAISDGACRAAIHDGAVVPGCQKQGIGTTIMEKIRARLSQGNVILYKGGMNYEPKSVGGDARSAL